MTATDGMPLEGCRVLLVEDEPILILDLADTLTRAGAAIVAHATSVMSGLYHAKSKNFDCAVMNVKLQGGYVYPVAKTVRDRGKGVVFVTAHAGIPELRNWHDAEIIKKPADPEDVIGATAKACWKGRSERR